MLEVMIERWSNAVGSIDYRWSVWRDGSRLGMGGPHATADAAEAEAREMCRVRLGGEPQSLVQL